MSKRKKDFLEQIDNHINIIRKICNVYCHTGCDKEDLVQDIIYQLWKSFRSFESRSSFSTWMYRVALNTAIGYTRKKPSKPIDQGQELSLASMVEDEPDEMTFMVESLYDAIGRLMSIDKAIIMLWLEKKSYREISEVTGLSEKNVSVRLVRIRSRLRELLKDLEFKI
ncbi:MAG TPA: sigma-70 family RNA polymerase sigma factor [Bacteroidales bacterium]|nr:sigma-70 family RNA polymerase sigma factor [Bacteroidales bacterium]